MVECVNCHQEVSSYLLVFVGTKCKIICTDCAREILSTYLERDYNYIIINN